MTVRDITPSAPPARHRQHQQTIAETDRLVDERERQAFTGYSRMHWWRLEQRGLVPQRIKLGPRKVAWYLTELLAWRDGRAALRGAPPRPDAEAGDAFTSA